MGTRWQHGDEEPLDRRVLDAIRYSDEETVPPEMEAVIEAGGGVAEGFELAEAELIDHAEWAPLDATKRVLRDARPVEAEPERAVYGEADHEHSSEVTED